MDRSARKSFTSDHITIPHKAPCENLRGPVVPKHTDDEPFSGRSMDDAIVVPGIPIVSDPLPLENLESTAKSEVWFHNAKKIDKARHTQLGTLGYLPPEIRMQIWEIVFHIVEYRYRPKPVRIGLPSRRQLLDLSRRLEYDHRRLSSIEYGQGTLSSLRYALDWSSIELKGRFDAPISCAASCPSKLRDFLNDYKALCRLPLHMRLMLRECGDDCRCGWSHCQIYHGSQIPYSEALSCIPANTKSVSFEITYEVNWSVKSEVDKHLATIRLLNIVVKSAVVRARTSLKLVWGFPALWTEEQKALTRDALRKKNVRTIE